MHSDVSFRHVATGLTLGKDFTAIMTLLQSSCFALGIVADIYTVSQKNCATFIFTVTLANVGRF